MDKFTKDLDSHANKPAIDEMTGEAMKIGATGTPASFVNGRYLTGAQPYEVFKKLVDEELAKSKGQGSPSPSETPAAPSH